MTKIDEQNIILNHNHRRWINLSSSLTSTTTTRKKRKTVEALQENYERPVEDFAASDLP